MQLPKCVKLVEVGARDGLQNETQAIPAAVKVTLIEKLAASGLSVIEAGSFVSPQWVPQMADTAEVLRTLVKVPQVHYPVLVPNLRGLELAKDNGCDEIAIFTAASETFNQKNINCSIRESLAKLAEVAKQAQANQIRVRGYISCVLGCPYEGKTISTQTVHEIAYSLLELGCYEISLGDTIGVGTANEVETLLDAMLDIPKSQLAVHFHDTYGQALANILTAMQCDIRIIDSAIAGLGGCPYAPGASGNVATEDLVYLLNGLGISCGVDLSRLLQASQYICEALQRKPSSKVACAMLANKLSNP